jgi:hypothetical protein
MLEDGFTLEALRVCTDGAPNACSMLYGALWRAARALGWRRMVTYTLRVESGVSLKAAGWRCSAEVAAQSWSRRGRPRDDPHAIIPRQRWEVTA